MTWKKIVSSSFLLVSGVTIGIFLHSQLSAQVIPSQVSSSSSSPSANVTPSIPSSFSAPSSTTSTNENLPVPQANPQDPSIAEHTLSSGGRSDIVEVGDITVSQPEAYTGDDITFTVTVENVAPYKKFVEQFCFTSNEGNFGCSLGFNLNPGQVFSISNSGRFTSSGVKSVGVSWTQDGVNFYSPVNAATGIVTIL